MPGMHSEPLLWSAAPSWRQFSWLYLISLLVAWRGVLFWQVHPTVGAVWMAGALLLLGCAAAIRRWGRYELSEREVRVRNGYTGRIISAFLLSEVASVAARQGPIAALLGIGTVVIRGPNGRLIRFRGVSDPLEVKDRIETIRRRHGGRDDQAVSRAAISPSISS